ncbi:hypothetical protein EC973_009219 [Apophysomyces ossiformis]|uniref:Uncharacterized protein n=1 Tax=Apophysomyces ossiformis TaxID=679940 RepID=A0A8H7BRP6_9FUNG|nr:hypothetical protein EC973_009219 [Apophysomyces ossiformis]
MMCRRSTVSQRIKSYDQNRPLARPFSTSAKPFETEPRVHTNLTPDASDAGPQTSRLHSMIPAYALSSQSVNPANLLELQVLAQVVVDLQNKNNIRGSIPYLAKIAQIVDNQRLTKPQGTTDAEKSRYEKQSIELNKVKADAHAQLADAYYRIGNYVNAEASLSFSVDIWEKLLQRQTQQNANEEADIRAFLLKAYDRLKECYEVLDKQKMASYMEARKSKLLDKSQQESLTQG